MSLLVVQLRGHSRRHPDVSAGGREDEAAVVLGDSVHLGGPAELRERGRRRPGVSSRTPALP